VRTGRVWRGGGRHYLGLLSLAPPTTQPRMTQTLFIGPFPSRIHHASYLLHSPILPCSTFRPDALDPISHLLPWHSILPWWLASPPLVIRLHSTSGDALFQTTSHLMYPRYRLIYSLIYFSLLTMHKLTDTMHNRAGRRSCRSNS
jgi:hypothetical protein